MDILLERMLSVIPRKPDGKYVHGEKKKFCSRIGAPVNIISEWETGKTKSYRNYVYAVAAEYNVSVAWLRGETDIKEKPAPKTGDELSEGGQHINVVRIAGRDGSFREKHLTDDQLKALQAIIDQLPDAGEDL